MSSAVPPSPLATPAPWDLVADDYTVEVVPEFEPYAQEALRLAALPPRARVVDVACGPGTLSVLAARTAAHVAALDFSPSMLARLRARLDADGITNVEPREADGQALPYADDSFDAAFSMFGVIFFPDRARGLAEMRRVVKAGGPVVISSWLPIDEVPAIAAVFAALRSVMPDVPFGKSAPVLGAPDAIRAELTAAGLRDVELHEVTTSSPYDSAEAMWASLARTMAPVRLLARDLGDAWPRTHEAIGAAIAERLGAGPTRVDMRAYVTLARA